MWDLHNNIYLLCTYIVKLEVDLAQENVIQLHSGFIWVQAVAHLLLACFRVTPLFQSSSLEKYELRCKCIFYQKGDGIQIYSCTYYWMNSENIHAL